MERDQRVLGKRTWQDSQSDHADHLRTQGAFARHQKLINDYFYYHGKDRKSLESVSKEKLYVDSDVDILKKHHRFLFDTTDDERQYPWYLRLVKKYYDALYKEYAICDLRKYKEGKIGMRWRVEKEVIEGKGQFTCGSKGCENHQDLQSWEVHFGYMEDDLKKEALVKVRLCMNCSEKLNYRKQHRLLSVNEENNNVEENTQEKLDDGTEKRVVDVKSDNNNTNLSNANDDDNDEMLLREYYRNLLP